MKVLLNKLYMHLSHHGSITATFEIVHCLHVFSEMKVFRMSFQDNGYLYQLDIK